MGGDINWIDLLLAVKKIILLSLGFPSHHQLPLQYNTMEQHQQSDRHFGRELSFNAQNIPHKITTRNTFIPGQKVRGISIEEIKNNHFKPQRDINQNISTRVDKVTAPLREKEHLSMVAVVGAIKNMGVGSKSQVLTDYFDECISFMLQQESKVAQISNYMAQQP